MSKGFDDFLKLTKISIERDPWVKDRTLKGYCEEIAKESKEAEEAASKKDNENLKEELGDVFNDWAHACMLGEHEGLFTIEDVLKSAKDKILRRKPYLLEKDYKMLTKDEVLKIWHEVKEKEKKSR